MVHVTKVEVTDEDMTVSDDVRSTSHSSESNDSPYVGNRRFGLKKQM